MSVSLGTASEDDIGKAISAQADEATTTDEAIFSNDQVTEKRAESDTIEPNTYNIKPPLQEKYVIEFRLF